MSAMVVIPTNGHTRRRVLVDRVNSVLSNRVHNGVSLLSPCMVRARMLITALQDEQYLVRWKTDEKTTNPPLSWHSIRELVRCLEHVQDYLDSREKLKAPDHTQRKRKCPDSGVEDQRRSSPFDRRLHQESRTPSRSRSPSVSSTVLPAPPVDIYNGVLDANEYGYIFCHYASGDDIPQLDIRTIPTPDMARIAQQSSVDKALTYIRNEYIRRLAKVPGINGKAIHLINWVDSSTPSLRFRYISEHVLGQGVYRASKDSMVGCTQCLPNMGREIGCEYTKKCDCLEYAAVDESRLNDAQRDEYNYALATGGSTIGFPKKFPYFAMGTKKEREGCLVPFYLNSRRPIYECNDKCHCGPYCRNKNVQFGRQVQVEIFRANDGRGWGLRCKEDVQEGQFIDTYRGEVITDAEATRRENASSKAKASYLYSLDKFAESEGLDESDLYVVDGEFMGGPTKFINHSCESNCRQYTVSYNKHDVKVYDIAFFACRFIPSGEELTFDYLDKDEEDPMDEPGEDAIPCLCGAEKCRKWLWT
ncbi:set domain-containing [Pyrenophora seminiperda CCB06]|uniref:Set domain-containing n=1 Tax=Pyrenophora seminiperda CCB06 TaxID=1302712 RepID=A0A3M7M3U4_9PLEO|nr:set domain-containing [Pyrenophora seminiperda CCB06]